mmetsp:Transcript_18796/g.19471  ORF Transcript_18796/g.19471 Transcript_18796/m.19471 type:complete len:268 (+) Transcript_18796:710-1513(+)
MYDTACKNLKTFVEKFLIEQKELLRTNKEQILAQKQRSLLQEMLLANELEEDEKGRLSYDELVDQVCTLFFASFDTTSTVISFILNYLARNQDVQDKLRQELKEAFPNGEADVIEKGISVLEKLPYLVNIIEEVARISPFTAVARECIRDTEINGYPVKKGDSVLIDNVGIGVKPDHWNFMPDLDKFRPERWETFKPAALEKTLQFGFGGRICPGKRLATYEIKSFIAAVLLNHRMVLRNPDEKLIFSFDLGFTLKKGTGDIDFYRI